MHHTPRQLFTPAEAEQVRHAAKRAGEMLRKIADALRVMARRTVAALRSVRALASRTAAADPLGAARDGRPPWQSPFGPPPRRRNR